MAQSNTPVPPPMSLSHSMLHNPTFIQHTQIIDQRLYIRSGERPGYARLLEQVATSALHDSVDNVDPPKCHPNTRVAIIEDIRDWMLGKIEELNRKSILWLKGGAGAGKSAIARSVAERCSDEGILLGTFFFGAADSTRNHVGKLVATLSYQISLLFPEFRDTVATFIEDDPLIFGRSIRTQFFTLIVRPLSAVLAKRSTTSSTMPRLIIIDGLDECSAINSQRDLLFTLHEVTSTTALIRFLVCCRPESHLNNTFGLPHMAPITYKIFLDDDIGASEDIKVYLEDKFKQIKEGHSFKHLLPDSWPTSRMVYDLVAKASGHFIFAATVVGYIESHRHRPDERLNAIFLLRPPFKDLPFTELDALYRLIISKAENLRTVLDILAFPALYDDYMKVRDIEAILQLGQGSVEVLLVDLHSIVTIDSRYGVARFLHKSLRDFVAEPQRAGDLYRDLSRAQLFHIARVISIFSTPKAPQHVDYDNSRPYSIIGPITHILTEFRKNPDITKADCVSSDILEAIDQFPIFSFFAPLLVPNGWLHGTWHVMLEFAQDYLQYLYCIKDVCEPAKLMYSEQIRQYCKCILAVLDDKCSGNWQVHFVYAHYHLLHHPDHWVLPRDLSYCDVTMLPILDRIAGTNCAYLFGTVLRRTVRPWDLNGIISYDKIRISYDLTKGTKQASIFAMSASYCLASLCNEQNAGGDWHLWSETSNFDPAADREPYQEDERVQQYIFLMDVLPYILPLAGRYEPLVDMCRNKSFSWHSQFWPKKSGFAREAIDNYLHRMDSQEEMEMEM